jgi:serine/threonine protein kinase
MSDQTDPHVPLPPTTDDPNAPRPPSAAPVREFPRPIPCGDYELLGEIERGGMGIVYRARERQSGLLVALKMMLSERAEEPGDLRRFVLEARAMGELNHPGVVAIHSWGEHDGRPFYTMDFVPGVPLSRLLEQGPLPVARAVHYLLGIARAVAAAHGLGIVHRDLKPGNVIIDPGDQPRVLDFGLAKRRLTAPDEPEELPEVLPLDAPLAEQVKNLEVRTQKGAILGTPAYMAPEQVRGAQGLVGPPADVHALGVIFYEMLTGRPPFQTEHTYETLLQVVHEKPPPLRAANPRVPPSLEAFCGRCLEKKPQRRYPDAGALVADLERRWRRLVQVRHFAVLTVAGVVLFLLLQAGWLFLAGGLPFDLERLAHQVGELVPAAPAVQAAGLVLARLLKVIPLEVGSYLVGFGALVWLAAWVWHARRPWLITVAWAVAGAALFDIALLASWPLALLTPLPVVWFGALGALVAAGTALGRAWSASERREIDATTPQAEPYLQRLFASRVEPRAKSAARHDGAGTRLADFELGKTIYGGDGCTVRWGRQKSLDRPVLVWMEREPAGGGAAGVPGVVVRHPDVLALHAVGSGPQGRFLVTEPVAASALPELLQQRRLTPGEAAGLVARIARAVQAFHDQGAIHGRLTADWVLVRGDLEPVLCPCGTPGESAEQRQRDVAALGRLLEGWLPPRPRAWQRHPLAPLYRISTAVAAGAYTRPADLAADLERAGRAVQLRWRERWGDGLVLAVLVLPLLYRPDRPLPLLVMGGLAVGATLLGYVIARAAVQRWQLGRRLGTPPALFGGSGRIRAVQVVLILLLLVEAAWSVLASGGPGAAAPVAGLVAAGQVAGFGLLGACVAGLVTFAELLVRSLSPAAPP